MNPSRGSLQAGGFGTQVQLSLVPFHGQLSTHVADVTGDGQADFIASSGNGMTVLRRRPYW